ncbi:hypothetical protein PR048_020467 [Dryococelus australis]|uniref:Uncharacterized protein n=1 Tax=Dryococelus australis TaxID=614101 RepID=A0ABQ9H6I0_9NEOP|nr:hypothetical protein PR048_020467 [Dryococelus australis]
MKSTVLLSEHRLGSYSCSTGLASQKKFKCGTYETFRSANYRELLIPNEVSRVPYIKVGADLLENSGCTYLNLIDYYSHWLDICPLPNKS